MPSPEQIRAAVVLQNMSLQVLLLFHPVQAHMQRFGMRQGIVSGMKQVTEREILHRHPVRHSAGLPAAHDTELHISILSRERPSNPSRPY
mmetsp:Transcript_67476/g.113047  ORF Transcript_67476/g.113047 Transcript_67476/m.113047 type:complete len:90 (-) Transcript_67476:660-929(-)